MDAAAAAPEGPVERFLAGLPARLDGVDDTDGLLAATGADGLDGVVRRVGRSDPPEVVLTLAEPVDVRRLCRWWGVESLAR